MSLQLLLAVTAETLVVPTHRVSLWTKNDATIHTGLVGVEYVISRPLFELLPPEVGIPVDPVRAAVLCSSTGWIQAAACSWHCAQGSPEVHVPPVTPVLLILTVFCSWLLAPQEKALWHSHPYEVRRRHDSTSDLLCYESLKALLLFMVLLLIQDRSLPVLRLPTNGNTDRVRHRTSPCRFCVPVCAGDAGHDACA